MPNQSYYNGAISGTVYDEDNTPIPTVTINLSQNGNLVMLMENPLTTENTGTFIYEHLPPGKYQMIAEKSGHVSKSVTIEVNNSTVYVNLTIPDYQYIPMGLPSPSSLTPAPSPSTNIELSIFIVITVGIYLTSRRK